MMLLWKNQDFCSMVWEREGSSVEMMEKSRRVEIVE
jgi:hypothetical protein